MGCQSFLHIAMFPVVAEAVFEVPVDRSLKTLFPVRFLFPPQRSQLLVANEVPLIVESPILHMDDLRLWHFEYPGNLASNVQDGSLFLSPDVVYLSDVTLV